MEKNQGNCPAETRKKIVRNQKVMSQYPCSLLSHLYKLLERLLLNRIAPIIETHLIEDQAGFRPGKSTIGQLLNLTQHIEDGYQKKKITGAVFVDLVAVRIG